jgi:hypothetical protein
MPGDSLELYTAVMLSQPFGAVVNNLFTDLQMSNGFISVQCGCDGTGSLRISHNFFVHSRGEAAAGAPIISVGCQMGRSDRCGAVIDSNLFEDNVALTSGSCRGLSFYSDADGEASENRFHHLLTDTIQPPFRQVPVAYVGGGSLYLRHNRFDTTRFAVWNNYSPMGTLEAYDNWWGDVSGPRAVDNPEGRGDSIAGNVAYSPWCVDTTCSGTWATNQRDRNLHPSSFILTCAPNPFNSATVIRLEVPRAEIVRVELYDLLGRKVRELWAGAVADEKEIDLDGSALSSGTYFVRVTNTIWNRPLASTKLVLLK